MGAGLAGISTGPSEGKSSSSLSAGRSGGDVGKASSSSWRFLPQITVTVGGFRPMLFAWVGWEGGGKSSSGYSESSGKGSSGKGSSGKGSSGSEG